MGQDTVSGDGRSSGLRDLKVAVRTAMCPVCRCVGTTRQYVRPSTGDTELVCLRCGTGLRVDFRGQVGSVSKLVVTRVARLRNVPPAGEPMELEVGRELTLERWHELVRADTEVIRKIARNATRNARASSRAVEWRGRYAGSKRDSVAYVGLASVLVLLVLPVLVLFSHLTLLQATATAVISGLVLVLTFRRTFAQTSEVGSAELPIMVSSENEHHLVSAMDSALAAVGIRHEFAGNRRAPVDRVQISCEHGSFTISLKREREPSTQPIVHVRVEPLSRSNAKLAERACKALGLAFLELGFYLKPIPPASGGVLALEAESSGKARF